MQENLASICIILVSHITVPVMMIMKLKYVCRAARPGYPVSRDALRRFSGYQHITPVLSLREIPSCRKNSGKVHSVKLMNKAVRGWHNTKKCAVPDGHKCRHMKGKLPST